MRRAYRRTPPRGTKVDGRTPLGRAITAHFTFNNTFASAARGKGKSPVVTGGPKLTIGPRGWFAQGDGTGYVTFPDVMPSDLGMVGAADRSFVVEFDLPDNDVPRNVFFLGDASTGARSMNALQINQGYRTVRFDTYGDDTGYNPFAVGGTAARVFLMISIQGTVLTFRSYSYLYATGQVIYNTQTSTLGGPLNTGNTVPLALMGGGPYNFASMISGLYHVSFYGGRIITSDEFDCLYADRHQVMQPPPVFPYAALSTTPVGDTVLAGGAVAIASAFGSLSTSIPVAGNGAATASASGALATSIRLAGTASAQANASGTLATSVPLVGSASAAAAGTGQLSTSIRLVGAAQAAAAGSGALSTSIALSGVAVASAAADGALAGGGAVLAGSAVVTAAAIGSLTTEIRLVGTAVAQASAGPATLGNAGASSGAALSGIASAAASGSGALFTSIRLAGAATALATAAGSLATKIALSGAGFSLATASGSFGVQGAVLSGVASAEASGAGVLSTEIALAGTAIAQASGAGQFSGQAAALVGSAVTLTSADGALSTSIRMSGFAAALASGAGGLLTQINLAGNALAAANGGGDLTVGVIYARAPAGPGYTPQRHCNETRPPAIQRNFR